MAVFRFVRNALATGGTGPKDGPSRLAMVSAAFITLGVTLLLFAGG